jgi:cytoskeletal protein RodZ
MAGVSTRSFAQTTRRPLVRVAVACLGVFVGVGVVWMSVGRARIGTGSSREPVKPAAAEIAPPPVTVPAAEIGGPPVENTTPPVEKTATPAENAAAPAVALASQKPVAASTAPSGRPAEMPPAAPAEKSAATERTPGARSGSVRVEKLLAGTAYKNFTCPNPATRFSAKSTRTVNVCLQVAHKQGKTEHLTLVWERNGGFSGKTSVAVPSSKSTVRTRARIKIGASRVGSWSVRAVSDRNTPLAETTFEVVP